jgi:D-arabinose 1-dehydrogenase-like Zn-dependent alcohol dehydrogenase
MGSPLDWKAMIAFVETHSIKPVISNVFSLAEASDAFKLMEKGGQFGKIILKIS